MADVPNGVPFFATRLGDDVDAQATAAALVHAAGLTALRS
jgi:hypothetical protein